jgi:hypothetical protein
MNSTLAFRTDTTTDGVRERRFTLDGIDGALWTPAGATGPLVLLGHGGGRDCTCPAMVGRAGRLVRLGGLSAVSIDAPGHGTRRPTEQDEREIAVMRRAMAAGDPIGEIVSRYNGSIADRAVPEWRAALDALLALPEFDPAGPVGYYGINLGTAIGVPLLVAEPRITAAVLGQFWPETLVARAAAITVPIEFHLQWDDEHIPRADGLALFDAFASTQKTLHANAGQHKELPRFEADSAAHFLARHLTN